MPAMQPRPSLPRPPGRLRQWGPHMEDVFARRDEAAELLSLVDDAEARVRRARDARDAAEAELAEAARTLTKRRNAAAPRFCREVGKQMARLEMGRAELVWDSKPLARERWTVQGPTACELLYRSGAGMTPRPLRRSKPLARERWTVQGPTACELLYRSGAGMTPRPLRRIASGGALSRVRLASTVVLGEADAGDPLVFDEVDAGVGGSTARSLAQVLADLARTHQVLGVTHLAQVAVQGSVHYVVRRDDAADIPETSLIRVEAADRIAEIARLLSGAATEESLAHATQLLAEAGRL